MKRWSALLLVSALCLSLVGCAAGECKDCAKLEEQIEELKEEKEKLENKIDKLEKKLEKYEPDEDASGVPPVREDPIVSFTSKASEYITVAVSGGTHGQFACFYPGPHCPKDTLRPYPATLNLDSANTLVTDSMIYIPVYGADGRFHDLVANSVSGTYNSNQKVYVSNDLKGFRAVGIATEGAITDIYAYVFDLSFQAMTKEETIACDGGYLRLSAQQEITEEHKNIYCRPIVLTFFDTVTGEILGVATANPEEATDSADEESYRVPLVYTSARGESSDLADIKQGEGRNISVLLWLDGELLSNIGVLSQEIGIQEIHLEFDIASR